MNETWKDVMGYEGLYQVSDLGHVRSKPRHGTNGGVLNPRRNKNGYLTVRLCRNRKGKNVYIHRLVAEIFIPNPLNLPQVNHKDEDKTNNATANLEWCTAKYNCNYGSRTTKLSKAVLQFDKSGNFLREWLSAKDAQKQMGFAQSNISRCCLGKRRFAYGFIWKYK